MVEALGAEYRLCEILPVVGMAKSSYEYAGNARAGGEAEVLMCNKNRSE